MNAGVMLIAVMAIPIFLLLGNWMARIKYGPNVSDIRGTIGQVVYSIWKSGVAYCRSKAGVISNPHSDDQSSIRENLAYLAKYWSDSLNVAQRNGWNTWALTKPGMGDGDGGIYNLIKGNNGIMSGFNAFVLANQWLKSVGRPKTGDAPLNLTPPTPPTSVNASYAAGNVVVTWVEPLTHKANAQVRIWLANHEKIAHRQELAYDDADALTKTVTAFKGAGGAAILFSKAPGNYIIQMDTVDLDGTKSQPSGIAEFVVA